MIKSNVFKFGYVLSLIAFWGGLGLIIWFIKLIIDNNVLPNGKDPLFAILFSSIAFVLLISIYGKLLWDAKIIVIDTEKQQIKMTNRFTRKTKVYDFGYFDGAVIINEPIKGGTARNYYLIKNRKVVERISGFMYANQSAIEKGLQPINNWGVMKYTYRNSWRILFGLPIIPLSER